MGTDVRKVDGAELRGMSRDERIHILRGRMAALGALGGHGTPAPASVSTPRRASKHFDTEDVVPVPEALAEAFPGGGLARRAVSVFNECSPLVMHVLVHAARQGSSIGVVGWPDLCFAEMSEYSEAFRHVVCVPDPGIEPLSVAATLGEGLDLVCCYLPQTEVTVSRARPLLAKLRRGTASVILVGAHIAGAAARVRGTVLGFHGVGQGVGRIRTIELKVEVAARGQQASTILQLGAPLASDRQLLRAV